MQPWLCLQGWAFVSVERVNASDTPDQKFLMSLTVFAATG